VRPDWPILPLAYLLGSIPFGLLIVKARAGRDIRGMGSGNIGAANVARTAGALAGVLTLVLDAAKGYLAVYFAAWWTAANMRWMMAAAVAAVVGHVFSVWLGFRGGKGVATGLGVFLPVCATAAGLAVALWLVVVAFWRYSSLGSVVAAAALPIFVYVLYAPGHAPPNYVTVPTILISLLVIAKHRANLARLIAGSEPKLDSRR
jgi:acyl phosphate:glycerol-3-phosphate acyltransferase